MRKLFEATQEWFTKHDVNGEYSNSKDSKVYSGTHTLFSKKLVLPFSGFTTFTILLESLPDAPSMVLVKIVKIMKVYLTHIHFLEKTRIAVFKVHYLH